MYPTTGERRRAGRVIVLGSVNVDRSVFVDALPAPGETVLAAGSSVGLGGKGANQAIAAARTGADVHLLASVGRDPASTFVREQLAAFDIPTDQLLDSPADTGLAFITVDSRGENTIAVVSGANADVDTASLSARLAGLMSPAEHADTPVVGLTQGEIPVDMVAAFADRCRRSGARFVLNLAPVIDVPASVLGQSDPLIVNELEAQELLIRFHGPTALATTAESLSAARYIVDAGVARSVVITRGADGAVAAEHDGEPWHTPAAAVGRVVDTSGAGDAFVGACCMRLAEGASLRDAVRWAVTTGSLAVTRTGTTGSYPNREHIVALLADATRTPLAEAVTR